MRKITFTLMILLVTCCTWVTQAQTEITQQSATLTSGTDFVDGDIYTDSGGSAGNYATGELSTLGLAALPGETITVTFTAFEVEASSQCWDTLAVAGDAGMMDATYSGDDADNGATLPCTDATDATGVPTLGPFTSSVGGTLEFTFESDVSVVKPGWEATISVVGSPPPPPMEILQQDAVLNACTDFTDGDIYTDSGGAGGDYANGESSTLELVAEPGETVTVTFTAFDVEASSGFCWDTLAVAGDAGGMDATYAGDDSDAGMPCTDATDPTGAPTLGPFTSAVGGSLAFTFDSDVSAPQSGWEATISLSSACGAIPVGDPPVITCPADIMLNNTPGECSGIANFGGTATDTEDGNISGDIVATPASGSAFPVGTTVVTLSVTDSDGNTSTCMFNVVVVDNEAAVLTCPADISQTNDAGLCGADVTVPAPMIDDNCPAETNPPTPVATSPQTDFLGTTALIDTPTVISGAVMSTGGDVELTAAFTGDFSFTGEVFQLAGPDGVTIINDNTNTLDCPATPNMAVATIAEATWNGWITTFGNDLTFTLLANASVNPGLCTDNFYSLSARQGDPVAGGTLSNDFNGTNDASGFYPVGDTVVTFTYTDAGGNVATCSMTVTVTDDEAPMIVCLGGPSASAGSATGTGGAIPDNNPVGLTTTLDVTDDFDITDLNVNLDITHTWIGDLAVTLTAPDGTTMAAIMDRPGVPATVVGCNNADPAINIDLDDEAVDTVEDSCPEPYVGSFIPNEALSAFNGISTLGTWTLEITDSAAGDTGTLNGWTLNYEYSVAASPAFPVILDADGNATVTASDLIDATASSDNCGIASITVEGMGGAPMPGSITTVFDSNNNGATGGAVYFDITVGTEDVTISDLDVNTLQPGALTVEMYTLVGTYVGNEGDPAPWTLSATGTGTASGTLNVPSNAVLDTPVTLTANTTYGVALVLDAAHGHYYSGTGTDPAPGMLMYSNADLSLSLGAGGNVPFSGTPFSPRIWNGTLNYTAGSGAPGPVTTFDVDCSNVGENEIEVTVTDVNGNVSTCTATYEVIDNIDPILVCQDFTLELGADGTAMLDPMDLIDMTNTIEACGLSVDAVSMDDFSCDDIGTPQTVTLFVSDPSGNLASCEATVTVVDLLGPEVTCPADMTVDPGANNQLYEVPDYFGDGLASATDNCTDPVTVFAQDPAAGSFIGDGVYTVTLSATDEYGNVGTCTFELTVESILGVNDNNLDAGVTLYPNPAQGQVILSNTSNILLTKATMYDVNGKLVNTVDLTDMTTEKTMDISKLASGVYIVQIEGENASVVKRLIKE